MSVDNERFGQPSTSTTLERLSLQIVGELSITFLSL
jgi:hypothetical protein